MTSISVGVMVIDCEMGTAIQKAFPRLMAMYDPRGNIIGISQVTVAPPVPVVPSIPRVKTAFQATNRDLLALILEDPDTQSSGSNSDYEPEPERQQPEDHGKFRR